MLKRRDELEGFLRDAGVPEPRRDELIRPITTMVDWDLRQAMIVQDEVGKALQKADRPAALTDATELLQKKGLSSEELRQAIARYRQLLTTGQRPRFGSTEDIRKPPIQ